MCETSTKRAFNSQYTSKTSEPNSDGHIDSFRYLLFTDTFTKLYSHEHILFHILTIAL